MTEMIWPGWPIRLGLRFNFSGQVVLKARVVVTPTSVKEEGGNHPTAGGGWSRLLMVAHEPFNLGINILNFK
jgi:hypothetical protein